MAGCTASRCPGAAASVCAPGPRGGRYGGDDVHERVHPGRPAPVLHLGPPDVDVGRRGVRAAPCRAGLARKGVHGQHRAPGRPGSCRLATRFTAPRLPPAAGHRSAPRTAVTDRLTSSPKTIPSCWAILSRLRPLGTGTERLGYDYRYAAPETLAPDRGLAPPGDFYALDASPAARLRSSPVRVHESVRAGHAPADAVPHRHSGLPTAGSGSRPDTGAACARGGRPAQRDRRRAGVAAALHAGVPGRSRRVGHGVRSRRPRRHGRGDLRVMLRDPGRSRDHDRSGSDPAGTRGECAGNPDTERARSVTGGAEPAARRLVPGDHLGKYRIEARVATGGLGVVYRATHEVLQRAVALKVLHSTTMSEDTRVRFRREIARTRPDGTPQRRGRLRR